MADAAHDLAGFLQAHQASLVILSGDAAGMEFLVSQQTLTLGRGPGVDLSFARAGMARRHAAIEWDCGGFRIRRLGRALLLNGGEVKSAALKPGDSFQLGDYRFGFEIAPR